MLKIYTSKNIYQATKLINSYKKQGFTFVRNFSQGQYLSFHGSLRTAKGTTRHIYIYTNAPITRCRIVSNRLVKNFKVIKKCNNFINGHSWGY